MHTPYDISRLSAVSSTSMLAGFVVHTWNSEKNTNLCQKNLATNPAVGFLSARTATNDPFVYRLGLQVFILARRVRFPYGSPFFKMEISLRLEHCSAEAFSFPNLSSSVS